MRREHNWMVCLRMPRPDRLQAPAGTAGGARSLARGYGIAAAWSIALALVLIGCAGPMDATQTTTPVAASSSIADSPLATPTATQPARAVAQGVATPESPLATPSPSATPWPTLTPTPTTTWPGCESFPYTISFIRDSNIWILEGQGGIERQLTHEPEGVALSYAPSPDSRWIAYITWSFPNWDLKLVSTETGKVRLIEESRRPRLPGSLAWLDDIHLQYHILIGTEYTGTEPAVVGSVVEVDLETGAHRELATTTFHYPSPDGGYELTGHWSPRGDPLPEHVPYQLLDRRTGEQRLVMEEPAHFRGWSPDSKFILFSVSPGGGDPSSLVAVEVGTGEQAVLTPAGRQASRPAWSPDGQELAYFECDSAAPEIICQDLNLWVSGPQGEGRRSLLVSEDGSVWLEGQRNGPVREAIAVPGTLLWTADGTRLVFSAFHESARQDIWSVKRDGSDLCFLAEEAYPRTLGSQS